MDYGIKRNILRRLTSYGCKVTVVPTDHPAEDVLARDPDGIFLSNGPGDPAPVKVAIENIKKLIGHKPNLWYLPRSSVTGTCTRRKDIQTEVQPPRCKSSG